MSDKKQFIEDGLRNIHSIIPEIKLFDDGKSLRLIQDFGEEQKIILYEGGTEEQRYNMLLAVLIEQMFYTLPKHKK